MVEDSHGPIRIVVQTLVNSIPASSSEDDSSEEENGEWGNNHSEEVNGSETFVQESKSVGI